MINADQILASPIHVGSGTVRCAHGILPVPAPATAHILSGVPIYGGAIRGELCTPTGAALLKHFVTKFCDMPTLTVEKVGYGMGNKDFEAANCIRAFLGETMGNNDQIIELVCNLDDMTPEAIGFALEILLENGALDVFCTPIQMKKNRPAVMLTCLCKEKEKANLVSLILLHTTTLGIRERRCERNILQYQIQTISTRYGKIRIKTANGYGITKSKPEFDDVRKAAKEYNVSFESVFREALHVFYQQNPQA